MCAHMGCAHVCSVEVRGQCQVSSSITFILFLMGSLIESRTQWLARLTDQQVPSILLSPPLSSGMTGHTYSPTRPVT